MEDERALVDGPALDGLVATLSPDPYYLSPGGRQFLFAASLVSGLPRGARVLDIGCGFGPASVDLAEAFLCRVTGFDSFAPYLATARATAIERGIERLVTFRQLAEREPLSEFRHGSYDVVLGLGGSLSDTIPGGLEAGVAASAAWLSVGGILICGNLVAAATPSELIEAVYDGKLRTESAYLEVIDEFGFDLIFAARATRADWADLHRTLALLRDRGVTMPPAADEGRAAIVAAAAVHPEVAFLNVVARRRPE
ncbi:MAG TPA: class I SAM-dependent methyltransferase [Thermomicrobiales bacterium]